MSAQIAPRRSGKTALVTGATSGIGLELAKIFARDGHDLILVARTASALEKIAAELGAQFGARVRTFAKDLAKAEAPAEIYDDLRRDSIGVDYLVNNAGFAVYGPFVDSDVGQDLGVLQLNMGSLVHLTRLFLPNMLARRSGKILNVASTAAFQPGPLMALYYASKAFVLSFSEALADELRGTGVTATALCPGPTETGWKRKAGAEQLRLTQKEMDPASVAQIGYRAMMRGKPLVIAGFKNQVMMWGSKLSPRGIPIAVVRRLHQRVK